MENYEKTMKKNYKVVYFLALEKLKKHHELDSSKDYDELLKDKIISIGNQNNLTQRTDIDVDWLAKRLARSDLYPFPFWVAASCLYYLLDDADWRPAQDIEWFVVIGLYLRLSNFQIDTEDFDEAWDKLPSQLKTDEGKDYLQRAVEYIRAKRVENALNA